MKDTIAHPTHENGLGQSVHAATSVIEQITGRSFSSHDYQNPASTPPNVRALVADRKITEAEERLTIVRSQLKPAHSLIFPDYDDKRALVDEFKSLVATVEMWAPHRSSIGKGRGA